MSGQGYHFALGLDQVDELLSCVDEIEILDWVGERLEYCRSASEGVHGGYKDWNILLCCFTNGDFDPRGGTYPLNRCFFGGRLLVTGGSIVNLVMPAEVADAAEALSLVDEVDFRSRYRKALPAFPSSIRPIAMRYFAEYFERLRRLKDFYRTTAKEGRAVLFYTDDPLDYYFKTAIPEHPLG